MTHQGTKPLESTKLLLRRFTAEDAGAMYQNWASDPEVSKYLTWPTHASVDVSTETLNSWLPQYENDNYYHWAIIVKENGDMPVGSIGVVGQRDNTKRVEIGYCVGRQWWGQGIVSEAFNLLIAFFFEEVKANRIVAIHDTKNPASGRVMEKCGLTYEGMLRQHGYNNQGVCDEAVWAILAQDYYTKSQH